MTGVQTCALPISGRVRDGCGRGALPGRFPFQGIACELTVSKVPSLVS